LAEASLLRAAGQNYPEDSGILALTPEASGGILKSPEAGGKLRRRMSRNRAEDGPYYETPQITLRGRNAWVVQQLAANRDQGIPEAAAWMIDQWISSPQGRKDLLDVYVIDVREYKKPGNVVNIRGKKHGDGAQ
jgi:hypothetical protein